MALLAFDLDTTLGDQDNWLRRFIETDENYSFPKQMPCQGKRILVRNDVVDRAVNKRKLPRYYQDIMTVEWKNDDLTLWKQGDCPVDELDFHNLAAKLSSKDKNQRPAMLAECYLQLTPEIEQEQEESSLLVQIWRDFIGTPVIPFDLKKRRIGLEFAYKSLESYMQTHRDEAKLGV